MNRNGKRKFIKDSEDEVSLSENDMDGDYECQSDESVSSIEVVCKTAKKKIVERAKNRSVPHTRVNK